jgi:hypothetical protein
MQREQVAAMQIDTQRPDPTADHGAFIGSVLICVVLFAGLLATHIWL